MANGRCSRQGWLRTGLCLLLFLGLASCGARPEQPVSGTTPAVATTAAAEGVAPVPGGEKAGGVLANEGGPSQGGTGAAAPVQMTPERERTVVAYLDDTPVTVGELDRFSKTMVLAPSMMGRKNPATEPLSFLPAYVRFFALVKEARSRKLDRAREVVDQERIHRVLPLGPPYFRYLVKNAEIPAEAIKKALPSQWTRMDFRLFVFETMEDAEAARPVLKAPDYAVPDDLKGFMRVAGKDDPHTGLVFPGNGFFEPFDDQYLFTLKEGELSRPVQSGLGAALALVMVRKDLTTAEQNAFIADAREKLADQYGRGQSSREARAFRLEILPGKLEEALREEVSSPAFAATTAIARVGDIAISFPVFLTEGKVNLGMLTTQFKPLQWPEQLSIELKGFCEEVQIGMAADKAGFGRNTDAKDQIAEKEFAEKVAFTAIQRGIWRGARVAATEAEERKWYEDNKANYIVPEAIDLQYYFTPSAREVEALSERAKLKVPFDKLGIGVERLNTEVHGEKPLEMKERVIVKGSKDLEPMQEALFSMAVDETRVLEVDMGYYVMHVKTRQKGRQQPFEEVRKSVSKLVEIEMRNRALNEEVDRLAKAVKVRMAGEEMDQQKGTPSRTGGERG
jgi:hypothetical protein